LIETNQLKLCVGFFKTEMRLALMYSPKHNLPLIQHSYSFTHSKVHSAPHLYNFGMAWAAVFRT